MEVEPEATLAAAQVRAIADRLCRVSGLRMYLTRRFFLRGEFRNHEVFTHTNINEVKDEWKVGFGFFY